MTTESEVPAGDDEQSGTVHALIARILNLGVDGMGRFKSAEQIADEHLRQHVDREKAINKLIATHTRLVAATGFATGLGGLMTLPVAIPTDLSVFYALSARCAAGVAHLRGYDVHSDEVRSVVLLTLLRSTGAAIAAQAGVEIGNKTAIAALRRLPGKVLIEINKKVGFRLLTKFGEKGVINLVKLVPLAGGGVGATVNGAAMRGIGRHAKHNFPKT